jgi:hypothetical protein
VKSVIIVKCALLLRLGPVQFVMPVRNLMGVCAEVARTAIIVNSATRVNVQPVNRVIVVNCALLVKRPMEVCAHCANCAIQDSVRFV